MVEERRSPESRAIAVIADIGKMGSSETHTLAVEALGPQRWRREPRFDLPMTAIPGDHGDFVDLPFKGGSSTAYNHSDSSLRGRTCT
jgi:hypothetical protein